MLQTIDWYDAVTTVITFLPSLTAAVQRTEYKGPKKFFAKLLFHFQCYYFLQPCQWTSASGWGTFLSGDDTHIQKCSYGPVHKKWRAKMWYLPISVSHFVPAATPEGHQRKDDSWLLDEAWRLSLTFNEMYRTLGLKNQLQAIKTLWYDFAFW